MTDKLNIPVITSMEVVPVAGYDSMLMTLSGAHAPVFTRNLVILKDSFGHTGIGEIHGGDYTKESLEALRVAEAFSRILCSLLIPLSTSGIRLSKL